jgi:iron complex outermembrane receptor protein
MHALSLKQGGGGIFDWEIAASRYDYGRDLVRTNTTPLPAADAGGAGRLVDMKGTGWSTLALRGIWRPGGAQGAHTADFGLQHERYALRNRTTTLANDWTTEANGPVFSVARGTTTLTSLWAQHAWQARPLWKTFLGGRLERWNAADGLTQSIAPAAATSADCDLTAQPGSCTRRHGERRGTSFSPKAAVAYQARDDWVVKLSTGRAVRYPTVSELYQGSFDPTGVFQSGDPSLKPERSWTTELSNEWSGTSQQLRATIFHETTRDALYAQTNTSVSPNVTNIQNVDAIRTLGAELSYQAQDLPAKGVDASASLTYADSKVVRNDKFPASVGKWQIRVPRWRARLLASWRAAPELTATIGARYSGRQYSTLDNSDPNGYAFQGASPFLSADLRVVYRLDRRWTVAAGIDNLNNDKYWNFHPYPQRTYSAELRYDH